MRLRISVIVSEMSAVTRSVVSSVGVGFGERGGSFVGPKDFDEARCGGRAVSQSPGSLSEIAAKRSRRSIW
jgi:hypothetical protein